MTMACYICLVAYLYQDYKLGTYLTELDLEQSFSSNFECNSRKVAHARFPICDTVMLKRPPATETEAAFSGH